MDFNRDKDFVEVATGHVGADDWQLWWLGGKLSLHYQRCMPEGIMLDSPIFYISPDMELDELERMIKLWVDSGYPHVDDSWWRKS